MSSFEKLRCAFGDVLRSLPSLHRKLARLAAVALCARNVTQPEPRLRINGVQFQNFTFYWCRKELENFEFRKNSKLILTEYTKHTFRTLKSAKKYSKNVCNIFSLAVKSHQQ